MKQFIQGSLSKMIIIFILLSACSDKEVMSPDAKDFSSEGKMIFWTSLYGYGDIVVYVDGVRQGTITTYSYSAPNCDTQGFVTVKRPMGSYSYMVMLDGMNWWTGTINIEGGCNSIRLR